MRVPLTCIDTTATLPDSDDVAVIGAGIVEVYTAWFLAQRGVKLAIIDRNVISGEQSSPNWGWCRQQNRDAASFHRGGLLYLSNGFSFTVRVERAPKPRPVRQLWSL